MKSLKEQRVIGEDVTPRNRKPNTHGPAAKGGDRVAKRVVRPGGGTVDASLFCSVAACAQFSSPAYDKERIMFS